MGQPKKLFGGAFRYVQGWLLQPNERMDGNLWFDGAYEIGAISSIFVKWYEESCSLGSAVDKLTFVATLFEFLDMYPAVKR